MRPFPKPTIVISKCLGFDPCRYDGEMIDDPFVARLQPHVTFISVCPEVAIGLGTPRAPIRVIAAGSKFKLIQPSTGADLSEPMQRFSASFVNSLGEVDGFILKNRSPSCGVADVKVYSGAEKGASIGRASGFFGGAVVEKFGHLAIEEEGRLKNLNIREQFLTRIFALARFREMSRAASMSRLIEFHAQHKLLLMAYNQTKLRELGKIVANAGNEPVDRCLELYGVKFREALKKSPSRASPINALTHALGYFKDQLSPGEKRHFLHVLAAYRQIKTPLASAISILRSWIIRFESAYLEDQTFFTPFPEELMALDDSGKLPNLIAKRSSGKVGGAEIR